MNELFDIQLARPLSQHLNDILLFVTFVFHMIFVLFAVGTAVIGVAYFIAGRWGRHDKAGDWARQIMGTLLAHKTLLVVLGVAPLLLIQVNYTVPFFTAANILAPFWLLVIPLVIVAFLALEFLGEEGAARHPLSLWLLLLGTILLLALPATFAAILTLTEAPDQWLATVHSGYRLPQSLSVHWLWRYIHVLGAAVVFGAAFHFLASKPEETDKKRSLLTWMVGGLIAQVVVGVLLYVTLPHALEAVMYIPLVIGVLAALALLGFVLKRSDQSPWVGLTRLTALLLIVLLPMLATRQLIQNRAVLPTQQQAEADAQRYNTQLASLVQPALGRYVANLGRVYDNGPTIYTYSCGFCHNEINGGPPVATGQLAVQPEWLTKVRAKRDYLDRVVANGVPGSAMPYFTVFTKDKLDEVITYLDEQYGILSAPGPLPQAVLEADMQQAQTTFKGTCASCHGADGRGMTTVAAGLQPPPPDFTGYNLTPERTFAVISDGYPGHGNGAVQTTARDSALGPGGCR